MNSHRFIIPAVCCAALLVSMTACSGTSESAPATTSTPSATSAAPASSSTPASSTPSTRTSTTATSSPTGEVTAMTLSSTEEGDVTHYVYSGLGLDLPTGSDHGSPEKNSNSWGLDFSTPSGMLVDTAWFGRKLPNGAQTLDELINVMMSNDFDGFTSKKTSVPGASEAAVWTWQDVNGDPSILDGEDVDVTVLAAMGTSGYYYEVTLITTQSDPDGRARAMDVVDTIFVETDYPN